MDGFTLIGKLFSVQVTSWVNLPPHSTNYHYALLKKSEQVSSPFERGSKIPCAVSINWTLDVFRLYTKAKIKAAYFIQQKKKKVQANLAFNVMWIKPLVAIFTFPVFIFVNHYTQPVRF